MLRKGQVHGMGKGNIIRQMAFILRPTGPLFVAE